SPGAPPGAASGTVRAPARAAAAAAAGLPLPRASAAAVRPLAPAGAADRAPARGASAWHGGRYRPCPRWSGSRPRQSARRRASTTDPRTSARTGTRAARSPAPRPASSRRAFPASVAVLVLRFAHQADLLHAGALQQHHRVHDLLVVGTAVAGDEDRLLRILVDDRAHASAQFLRAQGLRTVVARLDQRVGAVG